MFKAIPAIVAFLLYAQTSAAITKPNPQMTPGQVCKPSDADFAGFAFPENIARCKRNISTSEKQQVASEYGGIPQTTWGGYEFDHLIPLCAGGSNDISNLWPQPIAEAHLKDRIEDQVCAAMAAGSMTQAQAIQKIRTWFGMWL